MQPLAMEQLTQQSVLVRRLPLLLALYAAARHVESALLVPLRLLLPPPPRRLLPLLQLETLLHRQVTRQQFCGASAPMPWRLRAGSLQAALL